MARLKEVMLRAGPDGVKVAAATGWHTSKSSRLLTATTPPSVNDIRAWCRVCGTPDQADDLVAAKFAVDKMYSSWKRREREGPTRLRHSYLPPYERTRTFRTHASDMVPGTLQTAAQESVVGRFASVR